MTPDLLRRDAETYLSAVVRRKVPKTADELLEFLKSFAWKPENNAEKVQLVALATALVTLFEDRSHVVARLNKSRSRAAKPERLFVEAIYKDKDRTSLPTKSFSAWSRAVRHLVTTKAPPSSVPDLALTKGQGIDAWSRKAVSRSRAVLAGKKKAPAVKPIAAKVVISYGQQSQTFRVNDYGVLKETVSALERLEKSYPVAEPDT